MRGRRLRLQTVTDPKTLRTRRRQQRVLVGWNTGIRRVVAGPVLELLSREDMLRLTDDQWKDAFAAGGYEGEKARAFIARMKEKVAKAQSLP